MKQKAIEDVVEKISNLDFFRSLPNIGKSGIRTIFQKCQVENRAPDCDCNCDAPQCENIPIKFLLEEAKAD